MLDHCWADIMVATIIDGDLQTFCFELTLTLNLEEANVHWPNVGSTLFSQRQPYNPQTMLAQQRHAIKEYNYHTLFATTYIMATRRFFPS